MLTILGGIWKGRKLTVPNTSSLRPSSSKVRGSIFNSIEAYRMKQGIDRNLEGLSCLDLFAGVGGLGFEALSRGAERCVFVEQARLQADTIQKNAKQLKCESKVKIMRERVEKSLVKLSSLGPFDLIFADPPYGYANLSTILNNLVSTGLMGRDSLLILENHSNSTTPLSTDHFQILASRNVGPASLTIFTRRI